MPEPYVIDVSDLEGTRDLGRRLARRLFPGAVVALIGPLGAGKTHFVKAVAEGLDIPSPAAVTSPTFVLIQEYEARLPLYHFDAYRLSGEAEFAELGAHEYFQGDGVSLVEWADKVPACLPADHLEVRIEPTGDTSRRFRMSPRGSRHAALMSQVLPTSQTFHLT